METIYHRPGRFTLSALVVQQQPEIIQAIFAQVIPFRVDQQIETETYEYFGWSNQFDAHDVEVSSTPPEYDWYLEDGRVVAKRLTPVVQ